MSEAGGKQYLINVDNGEQMGPLSGSKGDMTFPEPVRGWSDVLDCRHTPYTDKPIDELRHFARHIHKLYLLVFEGQMGQKPVTVASDDE